MFKKIIALTLIFAILVPFTAAAAADEPSESRSMEEILDEYHRRAFEAQAQGSTRSVSANSRSGGKTLEEETVDALTEAGYEAYNVTAGNYDTLETQLQTDFAAMGLDPEGSYIIVIHGEPEGSETNGNSRMIDPPTEEDFDGPGGYAHFEYLYNGNIYWMRYVTVIATGWDTRTVTQTVTPTNPDVVSYFLNNLFSSFVAATVDKLFDELPLGSTALLLLSAPDDYIFADIPPGMPTIRATTNWNSSFIQVLDEEYQRWTTAHSSEYTITEVVCIRTLATGEGVPVTQKSQPKLIYNYSRFYFDEEERKQMAMEAYDDYTVYCDTVQHVYLYLGTADGEILFETEGEPLLVHHRKLIPHLENMPME